MNPQKTIDGLVAWLQTAVPQDIGLLVPVSGGSDSALCFWLCNQAAKDRTKGIFIGTDLRRHDWFTALGNVELADIKLKDNNPEVQRWAHFLTVSIQENRALLGSRNLTESTLGTFSNASRVAAILPLAGIWKHEVMELCDYVGVPEEITESSRKADPDCGRPEKMADIPYEIVDKFLQAKLGIAAEENLSDVTPVQYEYLDEVYNRNVHKLQLPLIGPEASTDN